MGLTRATLTNVSKDGAEPVRVLFNPKEITLTTNMLYPEISVPGLRMPLQQFLRGEARTLAAELYLDQSNSGESLADKLQELRDFVTIDGALHAPPVCLFAWGDTSFTGVMVEFLEKFQMFDEAGHVLRARVTVKLRSYEPASLQYKQLNPQSPDRTKTRTAREGDRYDLIAFEEYGDSALWPRLAAENGDERPRLLAPGRMIRIPPL